MNLQQDNYQSAKPGVRQDGMKVLVSLGMSDCGQIGGCQAKACTLTALIGGCLGSGVDEDRG